MKKLLLASAMTLASAASQAQTALEAGYASLDFDDVTLGAIYVLGAYEFHTDNNFSSAIEVALGYGITDDTTNFFGGDVDVELDSLWSIGYRGTFDFSNGAYVFFSPSYAKAEISADGFGSGTSDWELGIGVGAGYEFTDGVSGEVQYDSIDDVDMISAGVRFNF